VSAVEVQVLKKVSAVAAQLLQVVAEPLLQAAPAALGGATKEPVAARASSWAAQRRLMLSCGPQERQLLWGQQRPLQPAGAGARAE
jgi:hypothetical protein